MARQYYPNHVIIQKQQLKQLSLVHILVRSSMDKVKYQ